MLPSRAGVIVGTLFVCVGLALVASCAPARAHEWYPLAGHPLMRYI